jgi:hypothetical protein
MAQANRVRRQIERRAAKVFFAADDVPKNFTDAEKFQSKTMLSDRRVGIQSVHNTLMPLIRAFAVLMGASALLSAQTYTAVVAGSGYQAPPLTSIAPGQIATFFVGGLPQTSAGLTKMAAQISVAPGQTQQVQVLSTKVVDSETIAVTVQFPFAGVPNGLSNPYFVYTIQFAETNNPTGDLCAEGACTPPVALQPEFDLPHLINTCDVFVSGGSAGGDCVSAVFHQNGTLVTSALPAAPSEIVTAWAVGLGAPTGGVPAGATAPIEMDDITLSFSYSCNCISPDLNLLQMTAPYLWAGLPNPAEGVYQVNFAIPPAPVSLTGCTATTGNLLVYLGRSTATTSELNLFPTPSGSAVCMASN